MKINDIDTTKEHILQLCQNPKGRRYYELYCVADPIEKNCVFTTEVIPIELLEPSKINSIQKHCKLSNGQGFGFGGHGEWFTESEMKSMLDYDLGKTSEVIWETESEPFFPPK